MEIRCLLYEEQETSNKRREQCPATTRSLRQIGVTRCHAISSRVEDQGFGFTPPILFDFPQKNYMVPAIHLPHLAAHEVRARPSKQRTTRRSRQNLYSFKLIDHWRRELSGQVVLIRRQYVDRKMTGLGEIREARRLPRHAPQY